MLYLSPLKLDLKAYAISPINVAQRFAVGLSVCAALTERIAIWVPFLASPSLPDPDPDPGPGALQADDANSGLEPHLSPPISE